MRNFPYNYDCPLTEGEKDQLEKVIGDMEAEAYFPFKKRSGGFATATVYKYDEFTVYVELKCGVDGEAEYTSEIEINRENPTEWEII